MPPIQRRVDLHFVQQHKSHQICTKKTHPARKIMRQPCSLKKIVECEDVAHNCTLSLSLPGIFSLTHFHVVHFSMGFDGVYHTCFLQSFFIDIRPDISAIRDRAALSTNTNQLTTMQFQPPALEDLEAPRRQTSLDGEAIKIIIHDVDSGPFLASKRRVTLRRDPTDKAHRSNSTMNIFFVPFCCCILSRNLHPITFTN